MKFSNKMIELLLIFFDLNRVMISKQLQKKMLVKNQQNIVTKLKIFRREKK